MQISVGQPARDEDLHQQQQQQQDVPDSPASAVDELQHPRIKLDNLGSLRQQQLMCCMAHCAAYDTSN